VRQLNEDFQTYLERAEAGLLKGPHGPAEPKPPCPMCKGFGIVSRAVPVGHEDFGLEFPCQCRLLEGSQESFANFVAGNNVDLKHALEATMNWVSGQGPAFLVLKGPRGVGKSHLGLAACHALHRLHRHYWMIADAAIDRAMRRSFDTDGTDYLIQAFQDEPNLILDDLGLTARKETGTLAGLLDSIINDRWIGARDGSKRTMITTNVEPRDLPARMASRLNDATRARAVEINAPDYRGKVREE
jgi:chromosomal replication initiation ATPase DnaA